MRQSSRCKRRRRRSAGVGSADGDGQRARRGLLPAWISTRALRLMSGKSGIRLASGKELSSVTLTSRLRAAERTASCSEGDEVVLELEAGFAVVVVAVGPVQDWYGSSSWGTPPTCGLVRFPRTAVPARSISAYRSAARTGTPTSRRPRTPRRRLSSASSCRAHTNCRRRSPTHRGREASEASTRTRPSTWPRSSAGRR